MFPLSQIGPDSVTLRSPAHIAAGAASVVMVVDGREHRWSVVLTRDIQLHENSPEVRVRLGADNLVTPGQSAHDSIGITPSHEQSEPATI